MNNIKILDCTLRDGGYINDWNFGNRTIKSIIRKLEEAQIDIIECGFLRDVEYDPNVSVYSSVKQISDIIRSKKQNTMYVAMIALGDIDIDLLEDSDHTSIDGIRLTFHKHEWDEAKSAVIKLANKGYKVFVQPVGTTSYSDLELISLINDVNSLNPYAFYLVDTLGVLYRKEMCRLFYLIDNNLNKNISIGFHSHNNLQLSFSNAQELIALNPKRQVIIDSSVYGMGRGVGNLPTELIAEYINDNISLNYSILPILSIADKFIMPIYAKQKWGYDLPYFLSASVCCHPNYASYLLRKSTLKIDDIHNILNTIPKDKKELFDSSLIEQLYLDYQKYLIDDSDAIRVLKNKFHSKEILLIAPGGSIDKEYNKIQDYIKENKPVVISINHIPEKVKADMIFVSNSKRFDALIEYAETKPDMIVTSNIQTDAMQNNIIKVNYSSYIGDGRAADNAGAMLIRLLRLCAVDKVALAGFDGFSKTAENNFSIESYRVPMNDEEATKKNMEISHQLSNALKPFDYKFITQTRYIIK